MAKQLQYSFEEKQDHREIHSHFLSLPLNQIALTDDCLDDSDDPFGNMFSGMTAINAT